MLLNSVVIVLREVLEAALLLSVFLACAAILRLGRRWALIAIVTGLLGAFVYGYQLDPISGLFDGVGQEIINALLQYATFVSLGVAVFLIGRRLADAQQPYSMLATLMAAAVALAITREGSEILVYVSGFWSFDEFFSAVAVGSIIGACIGFSTGVLIYYLLVAQTSKHALSVSLVLLVLIAAGMSSQATRLLIQADWISTAGPLWNTSWLLPEESLPGQLLYALLGYEASPAAIEVAVHVGSMLLVAALYFAGRYLGSCAADVAE